MFKVTGETMGYKIEAFGTSIFVTRDPDEYQDGFKLMLGFVGPQEALKVAIHLDNLVSLAYEPIKRRKKC